MKNIEMNLKKPESGNEYLESKSAVEITWSWIF